ANVIRAIGVRVLVEVTLRLDAARTREPQWGERLVAPVGFVVADIAFGCEPVERSITPLEGAGEPVAVIADVALRDHVQGVAHVARERRPIDVRPVMTVYSRVDLDVRLEEAQAEPGEYVFA